MPALSITKAYASGSAFTEAHIDNFRNALLTLFNTTKFDADNFNSSMTLTDAKFSTDDLTTTDNAFIKFGDDDDGQIGLDASKNLVFKTTQSSCDLDFYVNNVKHLCFDGSSMLVYGDVYFGLGNSTYTLLYALSRYRKPVLKYNTFNTVFIENNTGTSDETLIAFPTRLIGVTETVSGTAKYRYADISVTANGYESDDTGNARGGMRNGLTLTDNTWYCVYAVRVRYGNDAGNQFILVFDTTTPSQSNESTLNTRYGENEWVYMGLIRYGYGQIGPSNWIIPFQYSSKGWCHFTDPGTSGMGGPTFFSASNDTDDTPMYTVADGTSSLTLPLDIIKRAQWSMYRNSSSIFRARDSSDVTFWGSGCIQGISSDYIHGAVVELPVFSGMDFTQERVRTGAQTKRLFMTGFCDSVFRNKRNGRGS